MSYPPPPPPPGPPAPPPAAAAPEVSGRSDAGTADPAWPPLPDGWWRGTQPGSTFPVPFTLFDGFGLLAWFVIGQIVIGTPLIFLVGALGADTVDLGRSPALLGVTVATQLLVVLTSLAYLKLQRRLNWRMWGPVRPRWSHVGWGALVGLGGFLGIQVVVGILLSVLGETDQPEQALLSALGDDVLVTVLVLLAAVVLAPIGEELIFRGVLFRSLRRRVGLWPAATISSAIFGAIHIEVVATGAIPGVLGGVVLLSLAVIPRFPLVVRLLLGSLGLAALAFAVAAGGWAAVIVPAGLGALGFVFALALHRSGNLLVPIVGHAVFNGIVVGLALIARATGIEV